MTPEERFERIEPQLELVARYLTHMAERGDRNAEGLEQLGARVDQTSRDVAKLVDAVTSLVRLFERHTGDGHGGK
jgi:3-hydroxyisobutyrate dehydrogenase-like beta-hydroxyacid dehydrogenase